MKYIEFKVGDRVRMVTTPLLEDGTRGSWGLMTGGKVVSVDYSLGLPVHVEWPNGDLSLHTVRDLAADNEDVRVTNATPTGSNE